jgi:hypothetical protein
MRRYRSDLIDALSERFHLGIMAAVSGLDRALPGLKEFSDACDEWEESARMAAELREWWSRRKSDPKPPPPPIPPGTPVSVAAELDRVISLLTSGWSGAAQPGASQYDLGYQAGLKDAIRTLKRPDQAISGARDGAGSGSDVTADTFGLPRLPVSYCMPRPGPAQDAFGLPGSQDGYFLAIAGTLPELTGGSASQAQAAEVRELIAALPGPPMSSHLRVAWTQSKRNEEAIVTLVERIQEHYGLSLEEGDSRAAVARQLDQDAGKLTSGGSVPGAGFPNGYDAAHRHAAGQLRARAGQIRPPWPRE